ncbi:MAG TPA: amidase, partial [Chloroflexota bacterium]|nr:amidase [Chloroflexota bacterium]
MIPEDMAFATISELAPLIHRREVSSVELTQLMLERIHRINPLLNAFITVTGEQAVRAAEAADREIATGHYRGPLHGIPMSLKDLYGTVGVPTTGGSRILADFRPQRDATVTRRLAEAGAILVGKTNMHEFAYGTTTINPHYGVTRNPWDSERITAGSSGGSAAAVAAGMSYVSMGSETGWSIRRPAAFCGVVGLKATYGRVSRAGVLPLAWSLDHAGPLTRSVVDAGLVLNAIAGYDPADPASRRAPAADFNHKIGLGVKG